MRNVFILLALVCISSWISSTVHAQTSNVTCSDLPALTGDTQTAQGTCQTTTTSTNGVPFGNAAVANTGTSGATIPLNNSGFTQSGAVAFSGNLQVSGGAVNIVGSGAGGADHISNTGINGVTPVTSFGAVSSTTAIACSAVLSNPTLACTTAGDFKVGQAVVLEVNGPDGPGALSTLSQPTIIVQPTTLDTANLLPTPGCTISTTTTGSIPASSNILTVSNTKQYGVGDGITVAGAGGGRR